MDWTNIMIAAFAFFGTATGAIAGIKQANKVVELRLCTLEKKMDKHNNIVERLTKLEVAFEDEKEDCARRLTIVEKALPRKAQEG